MQVLSLRRLIEVQQRLSSQRRERRRYETQLWQILQSLSPAILPFRFIHSPTFFFPESHFPGPIFIVQLNSSETEIFWITFYNFCRIRYCLCANVRTWRVSDDDNFRYQMPKIVLTHDRNWGHVATMVMVCLSVSVHSNLYPQGLLSSELIKKSPS